MAMEDVHPAAEEREGLLLRHDSGIPGGADPVDVIGLRRARARLVLLVGLLVGGNPGPPLHLRHHQGEIPPSRGARRPLS